MTTKIITLLMSITLLVYCGVFTSKKNNDVEKLDVDINSLLYVGKYVLKAGINPNEPFVLNHLMPYTGQQISRIKGTEPDYQCFTVYAKHNHADDYHSNPEKKLVDCEYKSIDIECYILPQYGTHVSEGLNIGIIKLKAKMSTAGAWGFRPKELKVYDKYNKELRMKTEGENLGWETIFKESALVDVVNKTGPHSVNSGVHKMEGYKAYPLK